MVLGMFDLPYGGSFGGFVTANKHFETLSLSPCHDCSVNCVSLESDSCALLRQFYAGGCKIEGLVCHLCGACCDGPLVIGRTLGAGMFGLTMMWLKAQPQGLETSMLSSSVSCFALPLTCLTLEILLNLFQAESDFEAQFPAASFVHVAGMYHSGTPNMGSGYPPALLFAGALGQTAGNGGAGKGLMAQSLAGVGTSIVQSVETPAFQPHEAEAVDAGPASGIQGQTNIAPEGTAHFPVNLFIAVVGDGHLVEPDPEGATESGEAQRKSPISTYKTRILIAMSRCIADFFSSAFGSSSAP